MGSDLSNRIRNVTAVLGPTNTGKTHLAIERMLGHSSGMIGLPLRLLAREVYDKIAARVGADKVALITGEEKIKPERARYWVCTVEAMPRDVDADFVAIDEIQLAGDPDRGHVFTDRLLHARGREETLLLGAQTMRDAIDDLIPGANFISRPRLSKLTYAGEKKITRLPPRSAIVAFSASEVYSIAELIRRQRGGTAVVLGSLSPRTRNAQVALYQSGQVDFLVATDAIGMGLNLDLDHVAFSATRKFDGASHRNLTAGEIGQIAGRAGRYMNDGTFGVTGTAEAFEGDLVERLENHSFDSVRLLQWRNRKLDFSTLERLRESLRVTPTEQRLTRARMADDVLALETVAGDSHVAGYASSPAAVSKLWDVCQIPDYRKISAADHAELVSSVYGFLMGPEGRIPEDWFSRQVALADRTDGDIDTLSNRIAHIRTWTFVSNRADWLKDPVHWQERTRAIEDSLSDALHERLTQRFVDARTSALMKGLRDNEELTAEIGDDGEIKVENHAIGRLKGFRFWPDAQAEGVNGKAARNAASQVVARELGMRARRVAAAKGDAFKLTRTGKVMWRDEEIAQLEAGAEPMKPVIGLLIDEHMPAQDRDKIQTRLDTWIAELIADKLKPLVELTKAEDVTGLARGIAFQLSENLGALRRESIANDIKSLDQPSRATLRKYGVRFGAFNIFFPALLKPAPADLALTLWMLKHGAKAGLDVAAPPEPPRAGLTSAATDLKIPEAFYLAYGFHVCGPRAVRLDIIERLADQIRPLLAWRQNPDSPALPPKGSTGDGAFIVTPEMMSILGCSPDELGHVLRSLGFRSERRAIKAAPIAPVEVTATAEAQAADTAPVTEHAAEAGADEALSAVTDVEAPAVVEAALLDAVPSVDGAVAATAVVAEEKFEEVWRPKRSRQGDARGEPRHRRPHRERGPQRGAEQSASSGHRGPRGVQAPADPATGEAGSAPVAEAAGASPGSGDPPSPRRDRNDRGERRGGDRPSHNRDDRNRGPGDGAARDSGRGPPRQGEPGRQDGPRRDKPRGDFDRNSGDRGPLRGGPDRDRGRGGYTPNVQSAMPPKKSGVADPDSPFAALGALREALAKTTKDKTSS